MFDGLRMTVPRELQRWMAAAADLRNCKWSHAAKWGVESALRRFQTTVVNRYLGIEAKLS